MIIAKPIENLSRLKEFLSYDPDTGIFTWLVSRKGHVRAGMKAGAKHSCGYVAIRFDGVDYLAHRLAWAFTNGDPGPEMQIDHINADRMDNRISNLRIATHAENCQNSSARSRNKHGMKGVRPARWSETGNKKWSARIGVNKTHIHLGTFDTAEEAQAAYMAASAKYHGEFSRPK
jgi:hypothetical protein